MKVPEENMFIDRSFPFVPDSSFVIQNLKVNIILETKDQILKLYTFKDQLHLYTIQSHV